MQLNNQWYWKQLILSACLLAGILLLFSGCRSIRSALSSYDSRAADAIHSLDNAIATLKLESANWQIVIQNLEQQLTEDLQSTLKHEVQNLAESTVHTAGLELRCNAYFMTTKLQRELTEIRNEFVASLSDNPYISSLFDITPLEDIKPYICNTVPSAIDVGIDPKRRSELHIYGFDLKSQTLKVAYRSQGIFKFKEASSSVEEVGGVSTKWPISGRVSEAIYATELRRLSNTALAQQTLETNTFSILDHQNVIYNDISANVYCISDFHAIVDLSESGADLPPNTTELVISCDSRMLSEIPIIRHEKIFECVETTVPITPEQETFTPKAITQKVDGKKPDKEFKGHGPKMNFWLELRIDPQRKNLYAYYHLDAKEWKKGKYHKNYTRAVGNSYLHLYEAKDEEKILGFDVNYRESGEHIDEQYGIYTQNFGGLSPLRSVDYTGDEKGDEAGSRTRIVFNFREINVKVEKCSYK